jgi:hypothetical protein
VSQDEPLTLRCARHPNTETVLRCGRCETPICPKCLVSTPVGSRCPTCAQVKRFSIMLKPRELAASIGFGVAAAAAGTVIANFIPFLGPLFSFAIVGFAVGEAVSIGANRKRLRELGPIAVACLFVGYELGFAVVFGLAGAPLGLGLLLRPLFALGSGLLGIGLLLGALLAWMRVR